MSQVSENYEDVTNPPIISINTCMTKSLNKKSYIESFDIDAVLYLLEHKNSFSRFLKDKDGDSFKLLQNYYNNSKNGRISVQYRKKLGGFGRLFADNCLSLQNLSKYIRGSIVGDRYWDCDMVNAHPTILQYICKIHNFECNKLDDYVSDRDFVIEKILKKNEGISRSYIKTMLLSLINGGDEKYNNLPKKTKWLKQFKIEIKSLHEEIMNDKWFPEIEKVQKQLFQENNKINNFSGSVLNKAMCVYEDYFLQTMTEYFEERGIVKGDCVLCFDGVMIPKSDIDISNHINEIENIYLKMGINLKLCIKPFKKFPNLPDIIPKQIENDFSENNGYYWLDFIEEMTNTNWSHIDNLILAIKKKINKVLLYISKNEIYIRKMSKKNPVHLDARIPKVVFSYKQWGDKNNFKIVNITLESLLIKHGLLNSLDVYNDITFNPEREVGDREFNTWTGFKSSLLKEDEIDILKIEPIFDLLKKVWCNGDEEIFQYILSWFHNAFKKPYIKNKVAIILYSQKQQVGKGVFINKFLIPYIYGDKYGLCLSGLDDITAGFNRSLMNKLFINCDELQTLNGNYHSTFDRLKKMITDPTITIKIKYAEDITDYPDYSNFIACTNNLNCFKIEQGDSRYCPLECSDIYRGNFEYFGNLCDNIFNQNVANHFFSYCYYLDKYMEVKNIRNIPMTDIKRDMMLNTLSTPMKFLHEIKNIREGDEDFPDYSWQYEVKNHDVIKGKKLFEYYKKYCDEENEKTVSNTKFGREIKSFLEKIRKRTGVVYDLTTSRV